MRKDSPEIERIVEGERTLDGAEVELSAAIEALRSTLARAFWDGENSRIRFRLEPIELTVQVGVARSGKGSAGIRWHVLSLGGERSVQASATQTLTLRLTPVLFDEVGKPLPDGDQLIDDPEPAPRQTQHSGVPAGEPE